MTYSLLDLGRLAYAAVLRIRAPRTDLRPWHKPCREELERTTQLDRSRAFVRIGPMLGLAGTIIPLGPALQSLLGGDMAGMVNHLVVGFGAVVCGLVLSGVAYYITLVRERWARLDLKEMGDLCELLMRHLQRQAAANPAEVNGHKEVQYASLR